MKIVLTALGHEVPSEKIDNSFFESLNIGTTEDWIVQRTGIKSRHSVLSKKIIRAIYEGELTSLDLMKDQQIPTIADLSFGPWQQIIQQKQQSHSSLPIGCGALICGTSVPDFDIPANASMIAHHLGIPTTFCLDVNTACSSFVSNLCVAKALLDSKQQKSISIFNVERYSLKLDYRDRSSCVLFGDGSTACFVEMGDNLKGLHLLDIMVQTDPLGSQQVKVPYGGLFYQNGRAVQKFAIHSTCVMTEAIIKKNQLKIGDIRYFIGHQANLRMLQSAVKKIGFTEEQHLYNVHKYGNQGAAGAPSVLFENWKNFQPGDYIVLTVVGAGLTWGSALFRWL